MSIRLFSNIKLATEKQSAYYSDSIQTNRKISIISSIKKPQSIKSILALGKKNTNFYIDCSYQFTCIESQYLRIFLNDQVEDEVGVVGIWCSNYKFKNLFPETIVSSLSIPKISKLMLIASSTIITMRYKNYLQMYFVLHPDYGWIDITSHYKKDMTINEALNLINEDI